MAATNLSQWERTMNWVGAAFDEQGYKLYAEKSGYYRVDRSQQDYHNALTEINFPSNLPDDLRKMTAFLWVDGFFDYYKIDVWSWFNSGNFRRPDLASTQAQSTIIELIESAEGLNTLQVALADLFWWLRTRGDPLST